MKQAPTRRPKCGKKNADLHKGLLRVRRFMLREAGEADVAEDKLNWVLIAAPPLPRDARLRKITLPLACIPPPARGKKTGCSRWISHKGAATKRFCNCAREFIIKLSPAPHRDDS